MSSKLKLLGLVSSVSLLVSACATPSAVVPTDTGCRWTRPITWSEKDTRRTTAEVRQHNAAREAVCGKAPAQVEAPAVAQPAPPAVAPTPAPKGEVDRERAKRVG